MAIDRARSLRGAVAGAAAAGVWAVQQPLDRQLFGVPHDDAELLGKLVTRGRAWPVVGLALHLANGAAFGALYAAVAPALPLPRWARGPAAALAEHVATWPGTILTDRLHPAREELPRLAGDPVAFAQSAWRHLVFGIVLGELERRLNARPGEPSLPYAFATSSNGHGDLERAAGVARG
jgi:hypothetical protein